MSHTAKDLLIIYETEADQWATYLRSIFTGPIPKDGICCYDIAALSSTQDDVPQLSKYTCKLLILSKGLLEALCMVKRFFLARLLSPAARVVVLLCGVESLAPLLELLPLNGDECLQISSEQDAHEYLSTVADIVRKGTSAANADSLTRKSSGSEPPPEETQPAGAASVRSSVVVVPSRVPCGSSSEVFILLRNDPTLQYTEVEFARESQAVRVKPAHWNERTLCVTAPDFPAGKVSVTVYDGGVPLSKAELQYYSNMEEMGRLLSRVADPVDFMCQALQVSSLEKLDQKLSSMLLQGMPTGGFQGLQCEGTPERERHHAAVPSLLHFAAQYGLKSVSSVLLQCPGAERAMHTANRHGQTPVDIAKSHSHSQLHVLLKETLNMFNLDESNGDASVYEMMCTAGNPTEQQAEDEGEEEEEGEEEDDLYAPLGVNDEFNTIVTSEKELAIANRPPAPTPRPESTQTTEDRTPYITQVFQKKKKTTQGDADIYSLPTKQARAQEDGATYDTFVPSKLQGIQQLMELQQRVRTGSLPVDLSHWQRAEKGADPPPALAAGNRSQPRAGRGDDDSVYDKINIVHHTPNATVNGSRRGSQPVESDFYSKPLKGQHTNLFWRADKR